MCVIVNSENAEDIRSCDLLLISVQSTGYPWRIGLQFDKQDHIFLQLQNKIKYLTFSSIFIINYIFDSSACLLGFYKTIGPGLISYEQLRTLKTLITTPYVVNTPGLTLEIKEMLYYCFHSEGTYGSNGKIFLDGEYSDSLAQYLALEFGEWKGTFIFYKHLV